MSMKNGFSFKCEKSINNMPCTNRYVTLFRKFTVDYNRKRSIQASPSWLCKNVISHARHKANVMMALTSIFSLICFKSNVFKIIQLVVGKHFFDSSRFFGLTDLFTNRTRKSKTTITMIIVSIGKDCFRGVSQHDQTVLVRENKNNSSL